MRISKTGRAAPKVAKRAGRSAGASKAKSKAKLREPSTARGQALDLTPQASQLSGLRLAMQRLANGISNQQAQPLSGNTAQEALQGLRG